ncbi:MAG: insulinase family protein [Clostridiales bacterium]|nr:insulinase family protein [Clostridiales bacterium]
MSKIKVINISRGLTLRVYPTSKFKTVRIGVRFTCDLDEKRSLRALIPYVLARGCVKYPSIEAIETHCEECWGMRFDLGVNKFAGKQGVSFDLDVVNGKFLPECPNTILDAFEFVREMVFAPITEKNSRGDAVFSPLFVEQEKFLMKERIEAFINDKRSYAMSQLLKKMYPQMPFTFDKFGSVEDVCKITPEALYEEYTSMVATAPVDVFVAGDVDEAMLTEYIKNIFESDKRLGFTPYTSPVIYEEKPSSIETERLDVKQSKLCIGYYTGVTPNSDDFFAQAVYNGILGGGVNSKLFMNVRERASLCYDIASRIDKYNGIMMISAGIEESTFDKACAIIDEQVRAIEEGNITQVEFESAKSDIEWSMKAIEDSPGAMPEFYYSNALCSVEITPEEYVRGVRGVTLEDVTAFSKRVKKVMTYFLTGEEK